MRSLREQDFDRMAAHVVDRYLTGRAKLADAAAEEAREQGLNPDQIARLTQAANTQTFLRLMADRQAEGSADLTHEFDPIDARQVIRIVIDQTGVHIDPGEGAGLDEPDPCLELPDEMTALRRPPLPAAALKDPAGTPTAPEDKPASRSKKVAEREVLRSRKLAGVLEDQLRQAAWAFEDAHEELARRFRRVHHPASFADFEKDALAEHGDTVGVAVLNLVRVGRGLGPLAAEDARSKTATLEGHHLSDETSELRVFERMVAIARGAADLQRGLDLVRARCG